MDPVTKDYIDNRDELVEWRAAAIAAEIRAAVDQSIARSDAYQRVTDVREKAAEARDQATERRFCSIEARLERVEKGLASMRTTIIVTGLSVIIGIAGLNAAILQNMQSSFDSGRMVSASQAEFQRQVNETGTKLQELELQLRKIDALDDQIQKKVPPERPPGAR